jgi:excisionase family DNA binding protein
MARLLCPAMEPSTSEHDGTRASHPLAYTVRAASNVTGISRSRLYELMASGQLPYTQLGNRRLIRRDALLSLLEKHEVATAV